jgi:hypothetical protein
LGWAFLEVKLCAWKKKREKERDLEVGVAIKGKFWSVSGVKWSWRTEEPGYQA